MKVVHTDLFASPLPLAIAHGCNAKGVMGAGVAKHVRRLFPAAYDEYRQICLSGHFNPGDVHHWNEGSQHVFNLCTQRNTGPGAKPFAVAAALVEMLRLAVTAGIEEVHMPKIGCGIGGLSWDFVKPMIEDVASGSTVLFVVHDFEPGGRR